MSLTRYRNFLRLCDRWALDPLKQADKRDLGAEVRHSVLKFFHKGELTAVPNPDRCDLIYRSLEDLVNDRHRRDFPIKDQLQFGSMLTDVKTLQIVTSDEFHKFSVERSEPPGKRLKQRLAGIFRKNSSD